MEETFPRPPMQGPAPARTGPPWGKILLIGCAAILLLFIVLGLGCYFLFSKGLEMAKEGGAEQFASRIASAEQSAELSAENLDLLRELSAIASDPDSSLMASIISSGLGAKVLEDNEISEQELEDLTEVLDMMRSTNGQLGFIKGAEFMNSNPRIQAAVSQLQQ